MITVAFRFVFLLLVAMSLASQAADAQFPRSFPYPRDEAARSDLGYTVVAHYPATYMRTTTANQASGLIAIARLGAGPILLRLSKNNEITHISGPLSDETDEIDKGSPRDMVFNSRGDLLYIGNPCRYEEIGCSGVEIINTRDVMHPRVQAAYGYQGVTAIALSKDEKKLFVGGGGELVVLDVTNPNEPVAMGKVKTKHEVRSVFASRVSPLVFFTTFDDGLHIVDVTNARHPKVIGALTISQAESVVVSSDDKAAFVGSHREVVAVDTTNPRHPKSIGAAYRTDVTSNAPMYLRAGDSRLYVMTKDSGLVVLDVSAPGRMSPVGTLRVPNPSETLRFFVSDDEKTIYLPTCVYDGEDTENVGGLTVYQRNAPSFDCSKATSEVEKIICSNYELSRLDESLNKAYLQALKQPDMRKRTIERQRQWLKDFRDACWTIDCVKTAYQIRLNELGFLPSDLNQILMPPDRTSSSAMNEDLLQAAASGSLQQIKTLVAKGADVNARDRYGHQTVLMAAAGSGCLEALKFLVARGADVNAEDRNRRTLLINAAGQGRLEVVKFLVDRGADVNVKDKNDRTILMFAAMSGNLEIVKFFIDKGLDPNTTDRDGESVLMDAARYGNLEVAKLLIDKGLDVNAKNRDGQTVFMAAVWGKLEVVKFLIEKGADVNAKAKNGDTALKLARKRGSKEIVELLKAHGAKE